MLKKLLAFACLSLSIDANSANLIISGDQLTGAADIDVGGTLYEVQFIDGSCDSLFSGCTDFEFTTRDQAEAASQALLDQVFLDGPLGLFDSAPELTTGCIGVNFAVFYECNVMTPFKPPGQFGAEVTFMVNAPDESDDGVFTDFASAGYDTTVDDDFFYGVYAVWSPAEVPIPATGWMFISALVGLGVLKRKRA